MLNTMDLLSQKLMSHKKRLNSRKTVVVTPVDTVVYNSGYDSSGKALPMEEAPRMLIRVENVGVEPVYMRDTHWHNDLGTVDAGESVVIKSASISAKSADTSVPISIEVIRTIVK